MTSIDPRAPRRVLSRRSLIRLVGAGGVVAAAGSALAACTGDKGSGSGSGASADDSSAASVSVVTNVSADAEVAIDTVVSVEAQNGSLDSVSVTDADGNELAGAFAESNVSWAASSLLEPGATYTLTAAATGDGDDNTNSVDVQFTTAALTLDQQTFPSIAPLADEEVGVGMPVVVTFDVAVTDRETFQQHMTVTSEPAQEGSWHWYSDNEVRWRPNEYWQAGTAVTVDVNVNSVPAGNGIYGQESRTVNFTVGRSVIHTVDATNHQLTTSIDGEAVKTISISAGKPGYETRSGIKVIMEKFRSKTMDAATTGVSEDDPDYYNIQNVEYAMRVTTSGEFLHAAPWSSASQGVENVSHGCVGMATADAQWVYDNSKRGDVVDVSGTDRYMTLDNGWGDWNASVEEYAQASA